MEQKNTSKTEEATGTGAKRAGGADGFDPSSGGGASQWRALLPEDVSQSSQKAAKVAFARAGMAGAGETARAFAGGAPGAKTRAEAAKIVREAKKAAICHYSTPENLAELGAKLTVLLSDYGEGNAQRIGEAKLAEVQVGLEFGDEGEKAVHTRMMIDIYNGAVRNLHKAADKTGDRSFLDDGRGGEIAEAPVPGKLSDAYDKATTRDRGYVWTLETDKDGHSRVVRKNAPTVRDWANKTVDGMTSGSSMEEGVGYLLGSSLRAAFRLLPGVGEVDGKEQLRAESARLYQQVEALIPSRKGNIHPHGAPGERGAGESGVGAGEAVEMGGRPLAVPGGGFSARMSGVKQGSREARHAGHD